METTFERLAEFPYSGAPRKVRGPKYAGVRMALVKGFPNYLIFYFPIQNGVVIERVIHAKQDYNRSASLVAK